MLRFGESAQMREHIFHMHHIGIFMMHVEKIDLVRQRRAVKSTFFDNIDVITR